MSRLFDSIQVLWETLAPASTHVYIWGAISGIFAVLIFHFLTDHRKLKAVQADVKQARIEALHFDGDFSDLEPVIKNLLGNSFHILWLRLIPITFAAIPFFFLMPWAEIHFGYELPTVGEQITVQVSPPTTVLSSPSFIPTRNGEGYQLLWPAEGRTVDIRDSNNIVLLTLPPRVAKPAIKSKAWWNNLLDLPPYLPAESSAKELFLDLEAKHYSSTGYALLDRWDFHFTLAALIAALLGYLALKYSRSDEAKNEASDTDSSALSFSVSPATQLMGIMAGKMPGLWIGMGKVESRLLRSRLNNIQMDKPVFVTGLARAGTTILLEFLADLPGVVTHRYRDYPFVHIPYWWNSFIDLMPRPKEELIERSHRDGIYVTSDSPEAMEEILWMAFYDNIHCMEHSEVLDSTCADGEFDSFFRDSIKKLLLVRGGERYVSKGNYNVTRLRCLLTIFPDAKILISVRDPVSHIASIMKQDRLFTEALENNPSARAYLETVGHFEFGSLRKPIHIGDDGVIDRIRTCWKNGDEVRGWAIYWASIYGHILDMINTDQRIAQSVYVVRFEDMCAQPKTTLKSVIAHCDFADCEEKVDRFAQRVRYPTYYQHGFNQEEIDIIEHECGSIADHFGYHDIRNTETEKFNRH